MCLWWFHQEFPWWNYHWFHGYLLHILIMILSIQSPGLHHIDKNLSLSYDIYSEHLSSSIKASWASHSDDFIKSNHDKITSDFLVFSPTYQSWFGKSLPSLKSWFHPLFASSNHRPPPPPGDFMIHILDDFIFEPKKGGGGGGGGGQEEGWRRAGGGTNWRRDMISWPVA